MDCCLGFYFWWVTGCLWWVLGCGFLFRWVTTHELFGVLIPVGCNGDLRLGTGFLACCDGSWVYFGGLMVVVLDYYFFFLEAFSGMQSNTGKNHFP